MCRRRFHNVVLWRNQMTYKTNHREVRDIVLCFHFTAGLFSLSYCTTCCPHHEPRLLTVSKMTPSHTAKATIKVHYLKCHVCVQSLSCVQLFVIPWTTVHQAPLSMGFSGKNTGWVAMPSSRGSSQPRDQTQVSCTAGRFFTL